MTLSALHTLEVIEIMENYMAKVRPAPELRHRVDITYQIDGLNVIIWEVGPLTANGRRRPFTPIAMAKYLPKNACWKLFRQRTDGWDNYEPRPLVKSLRDFVREVKEDKFEYFWR